jgi:hypothetical protein
MQGLATLTTGCRSARRTVWQTWALTAACRPMPSANHHEKVKRHERATFERFAASVQPSRSLHFRTRRDRDAHITLYNRIGNDLLYGCHR